ncbi:MAG: hypothetical protein ACLVJO_08325 [[Clostridium] scindens]
MRDIWENIKDFFTRLDDDGEGAGNSFSAQVRITGPHQERHQAATIAEILIGTISTGWMTKNKGKFYRNV